MIDSPTASGSDTQHGPLADLHTHSTASDGTLTPSELVREALEKGITILALTDHDTCSGLEAAGKEAVTAGITFVPGVELSVIAAGQPVHILGLGLKSIGPDLQALLKQVGEGRRKRNPMIIRKLNLLGYRINLEDAASCAGGPIIGRPHIAQALVKRGYFEDSSSVFKALLRPGSPAYVHRFRPKIDEAAKVIRQSGGISVLAHPGLLDMDESDYFPLIRKLSSLGIEAVESNYSAHTPAQVKLFESICSKLDLIPTAGSDFHGLHRLKSELGQGSNREWIPASYAKPLLDALKQRGNPLVPVAAG